MSMSDVLRAEAYWQRQVRQREGRIAELEAEVELERTRADLASSLLAAIKIPHDLDEPAEKPRLAALLAEPSIWDDEPIPLLPVDPEEQRRASTFASDGQQAMIYRQPS